VHDQNGIRRFPLRILISFPQGTVMDAQFRQRFATRELEIANRVSAFSRCRKIARVEKSDRGKEKRSGLGTTHHYGV
jgi:hypothetical protein